MSVRELSNMPLALIATLSELSPSRANRYIRELCARAKLEKAQGAKAEISSHYQDSAMTLAEIHRVIGVCVCAYVESLPAVERLKLNVQAMTAQERRSLMDALLAEPEEEGEIDEMTPRPISDTEGDRRP